MVFLWKIFFSEMILVPSFVTPFINLVLWYVYILKIMIWCISTWFGTRNWYLWKGYCQTENKCQAEKAELKKKNILFLFTDIVKFNMKNEISLLAPKSQNLSDTYNFWFHGGIFYCHNKLMVYQTKALAYIELMKFTMLIDTVTSACKIGAIKGKSGHRQHTEVDRHL